MNKKSSNKKGVAHFASRFIVSYRQGIVTSIQSHKSQCYKDNVIKVISADDYKKSSSFNLVWHMYMSFMLDCQY
ncbi:hypothetical protein JCM18900_1415 [Psychrobacter sp. JCM 18900]|nr:hypothetical protein JCM18900_1415 [Psychrobacter sp. JCM 18900]